MKVVGVQILLHTIEYLIWLPVIASVCSTTPGALMFPVEVQNAARMMHEVGPSLTTVGRRRKRASKQCLNTQGQLGENKWRTISCHTSKCSIRAECVQYACRKTGNVWMQTTPHHAPQSSHLDTCCYQQSVPKNCFSLVIIWSSRPSILLIPASFNDDGCASVARFVEHHPCSGGRTSFRITIPTTVKTSE